jgi:hypothetical protein
MIDRHANRASKPAQRVRRQATIRRKTVGVNLRFAVAPVVRADPLFRAPYAV